MEKKNYKYGILRYTDPKNNLKYVRIFFELLSLSGHEVEKELEKPMKDLGWELDNLYDYGFNKWSISEDIDIGPAIKFLDSIRAEHGIEYEESYARDILDYAFYFDPDPLKLEKALEILGQYQDDLRQKTGRARYRFKMPFVPEIQEKIFESLGEWEEQELYPKGTFFEAEITDYPENPIFLTGDGYRTYTLDSVNPVTQEIILDAIINGDYDR